VGGRSIGGRTSTAGPLIAPALDRSRALGLRSSAPAHPRRLSICSRTSSPPHHRPQGGSPANGTPTRNRPCALTTHPGRDRSSRSGSRCRAPVIVDSRQGTAARSQTMPMGIGCPPGPGIQATPSRPASPAWWLASGVPRIDPVGVQGFGPAPLVPPTGAEAFGWQQREQAPARRGIYVQLWVQGIQSERRNPLAG
jgi:hypothetical protein